MLVKNKKESPKREMEDFFAEIETQCKEADLILVGIGEEFQFNWDLLQNDERYQEIEKEIEGREEYLWIVPFLQKVWIEQQRDEKLNQAYSYLQKLLRDKNYFIISTAVDDSVFQYGFKEDRMVCPVGGFRKMQCDYNCSGRLYEVDNEMLEKVKLYYDKEMSLMDLQEPLCSDCAHKKRFNQLGVSKYAEEGYLAQWEIYTKWLQGTVNRKLCILELGVGMEMPNIIRWPFEKIILYNQKSHLYRIHSVLSQLGENVGVRGTSIKENPVSFLAKGFVK